IEDCDVVIHTSATAAGLATALRLAGDEASVVELSWYGSTDVPVPLGGAFHSRRLRLISSQVGRVAASHRARWSHRPRLPRRLAPPFAAALPRLGAPAPDALTAPPIEFRALPSRLPKVLAAAGSAFCPLIRYPAAKA